MTANLTQVDLIRRNHRRAVRFFWGWLILATWVSLAGNVAHAWLTAPSGTRWLASCVAAVPPTVLLLSVHGLAVLAKVTASGAVYRAAVSATGALAFGAFTLSFVALRDLAIIAGIRPEHAPVLPMVIDLAIGVATLALVAIGDKPARKPRIATSTATRTQSAGATATVTKRDMVGPNTAPVVAVAREAEPPSESDRGVDGADSAVLQLAGELVAEKATRQPVEVVAAILAAHHAGDPINRIAKSLGVHHSAVSRVIEAAEGNRVGTFGTA